MNRMREAWIGVVLLCATFLSGLLIFLGRSSFVNLHTVVAGRTLSGQRITHFIVANKMASSTEDLCDVAAKKSHYRLEPRHLCDSGRNASSGRLQLLVLVCVAVHELQLRHAIRDTWAAAARQSNPVFRVVFVMGKARSDESNQRVKV